MDEGSMENSHQSSKPLEWIGFSWRKEGVTYTVMSYHGRDTDFDGTVNNLYYVKSSMSNEQEPFFESDLFRARVEQERAQRKATRPVKIPQLYKKGVSEDEG